MSHAWLLGSIALLILSAFGTNKDEMMPFEGIREDSTQWDMSPTFQVKLSDEHLPEIVRTFACSVECAGILPSHGARVMLQTRTRDRALAVSFQFFHFMLPLLSMAAAVCLMLFSSRWTGIVAPAYSSCSYASSVGFAHGRGGGGSRVERGRDKVIPSSLSLSFALSTFLLLSTGFLSSCEAKTVSAGIAAGTPLTLHPAAVPDVPAAWAGGPFGAGLNAALLGELIDKVAHAAVEESSAEGLIDGRTGGLWSGEAFSRLLRMLGLLPQPSVAEGGAGAGAGQSEHASNTTPDAGVEPALEAFLRDELDVIARSGTDPSRDTLLQLLAEMSATDSVPPAHAQNGKTGDVVAFDRIFDSLASGCGGGGARGKPSSLTTGGGGGKGNRIESPLPGSDAELGSTSSALWASRESPDSVQFARSLCLLARTFAAQTEEGYVEGGRTIADFALEFPDVGVDGSKNALPSSTSAAGSTGRAASDDADWASRPPRRAVGVGASVATGAATAGRRVERMGKLKLEAAAAEIHSSLAAQVRHFLRSLPITLTLCVSLCALLAVAGVTFGKRRGVGVGAGTGKLCDGTGAVASAVPVPSPTPPTRTRKSGDRSSLPQPLHTSIVTATATTTPSSTPTKNPVGGSSAAGIASPVKAPTGVEVGGADRPSPVKSSKAAVPSPTHGGVSNRAGRVASGASATSSRLLAYARGSTGSLASQVGASSSSSPCPVAVAHASEPGAGPAPGLSPWRLVSPGTGSHPPPRHVPAHPPVQPAPTAPTPDSLSAPSPTCGSHTSHSASADSSGRTSTVPMAGGTAVPATLPTTPLSPVMKRKRTRHKAKDALLFPLPQSRLPLSSASEALRREAAAGAGGSASSSSQGTAEAGVGVGTRWDASVVVRAGLDALAQIQAGVLPASALPAGVTPEALAEALQALLSDPAGAQAAVATYSSPPSQSGAGKRSAVVDTAAGAAPTLGTPPSLPPTTPIQLLRRAVKAGGAGRQSFPRPLGAASEAISRPPSHGYVPPQDPVYRAPGMAQLGQRTAQHSAGTQSHLPSPYTDSDANLGPGFKALLLRSLFAARYLDIVAALDEGHRTGHGACRAALRLIAQRTDIPVALTYVGLLPADVTGVRTDRSSVLGMAVAAPGSASSDHAVALARAVLGETGGYPPYARDGREGGMRGDWPVPQQGGMGKAAGARGGEEASHGAGYSRRGYGEWEGDREADSSAGNASGLNLHVDAPVFVPYSSSTPPSSHMAALAALAQSRQVGDEGDGAARMLHLLFGGTSSREAASGSGMAPSPLPGLPLSRSGSAASLAIGLSLGVARAGSAGSPWALTLAEQAEQGGGGMGLDLGLDLGLDGSGMSMHGGAGATTPPFQSHHSSYMQDSVVGEDSAGAMPMSSHSHEYDQREAEMEVEGEEEEGEEDEDDLDLRDVLRALHNGGL